MFPWKTIEVAEHQKALVFKHSQFHSVLKAGRHKIPRYGKSTKVEVFDLSDRTFTHKHAKLLMHQHNDVLAEHIEVIDLQDEQVGLLYCDNKLIDIIAPGSFRTYWKGLEDIHVKTINIEENYEIKKPLLNLLTRGKISQTVLRQSLIYYEVPDEHVGLLFVNGKYEKILQPGAYGYWVFNRSVNVTLMDLRTQSLDINGQDILTKDHVSIRLNLSCHYQIDNPEVTALKVKQVENFIYRDIQLKLRESVSTHTLDELLADKNLLNQTIMTQAKKDLAELGIQIKAIGVKDIILPGDMKSILNQVVEAQKQAEANLIKRKEETQAMRSMHNTAKLMENNPLILRLKELEALEKITEKVGSLSVYNGLEGVMKDLVSLKSSSSSTKI